VLRRRLLVPTPSEAKNNCPRPLFPALFIWTLLFGLLNEEGPGVLEEHTELGRICRTLCQDLDAIEPWFLPLTGGIVREESQAPQMQGAR
jgi:hypothetical protein